MIHQMSERLSVDFDRPENPETEFRFEYVDVVAFMATVSIVRQNPKKIPFQPQFLVVKPSVKNWSISQIMIGIHHQMTGHEAVPVNLFYPENNFMPLGLEIFRPFDTLTLLLHIGKDATVPFVASVLGEYIKP